MAVYLIKCDATGLTKIGVSDKPHARLKELQTGSPGKLRLVGLLDGGAEFEAMLHKRFETCRSGGEWFKLNVRQIKALLVEHSHGDDPFLSDRVQNVADALEMIADRLYSPNVTDSNFEPANLVDVGDKIARGLFAIAAAIEEASGVVKG